MEKELKIRLRDSAKDFIRGVQPALEARLKVKIFPIEDVENSELLKLLDQVGIDGFYYDDGQIRGLASRVNYHEHARKTPAFTFRFALWVDELNSWDGDREFARKIKAFKSPKEFNFLPRIHVESFSKGKGTGLIGWSFAAELKDVLEYYHRYYSDRDRIRIFEPRFGERRKVLSIPIEPFSKEYPILDVKVGNF
ncbi:MAG: hypothetical protein DCC75_00245 [Proteobacteria bacterium]|nr:MAG: hypothetical protein DCC75_00245 [Pseudomonadota bacterium]